MKDSVGANKGENPTDISRKVLDKSVYAECLAEFLGTFIIIFIGEASIATGLILALNDKTLIFGAWGFAVFFATLLTASISGAHLNPSVTLYLTLAGRNSWKKVPYYVFFQMLGGFVGAAFVYFVYDKPLRLLDPQLTVPGDGPGTAVVYSTYPGNGAHGVACWVLAEVISSMFFMISVLGGTDERILPGVSTYGRLGLISFMVTLMLMAFGAVVGVALNPARDFATRCFAAIIYGPRVFTAFNYYFLIGLFCPLLGGLFGFLIWKSLIVLHVPRDII